MIMSAGCQIRVGRKQKKEERAKEKGDMIRIYSSGRCYSPSSSLDGWCETRTRLLGSLLSQRAAVASYYLALSA
jgi:hypothetical protein